MPVLATALLQSGHEMTLRRSLTIRAPVTTRDQHSCRIRPGHRRDDVKAAVCWRHRADVLLSNEQWLATSEPELSEVFCRGGTVWGISHTASRHVTAEA